MAKKKPTELRSHQWYGTDNMRAFGHRSRTYQMGLSKDEFAGKPVIALVNTWSDINPCHTHLRLRALPSRWWLTLGRLWPIISRSAAPPKYGGTHGALNLRATGRGLRQTAADGE